MGLDCVEFVMAVEESFGIKIEDAEAVSCTTPRKLTDLLLAKLEQINGDTCLSQRAFYRLRKAFREILATPRTMFQREAELASLIPKEGRFRTWEQIKAAVGVSVWPRLVRPSWLVILQALGVVSVTVGMYVGAQLNGHLKVMATPLSFAVLVTGALLSSHLSKPAATSFPLKTVEELVRYLIAYDSAALKSNPKQYSRDEVRMIIVFSLAG